MATAREPEGIRYEPDERCPLVVSIGVGFQSILIILAPTVLLVSITVQAADQSESYLSWAVFAALIINGATTALQAGRLGRFGTGHVLLTGTTSTFIAISITALAQGGPAMLSSLIVVSSLAQFALAAWLPLLRRIITPVVSGTALMLIAVMVIPIAFDTLNDVPLDAPPAAAASIATATLAFAAALGLRASGTWRLWSSLIAILGGCVVAASFGLYDAQRVIDAPWVGIPAGGWPELDLTPRVEFWTLLPMFVVVSLVNGIKAIGDGVAVQRVSWRRPRATDFRLIQGTLNASGLSTLLSGIAGTPPTTVYSGASLSLVSLTGVASRRVAYAAGAILVGLALLPKVAALLLTIPNPVMGAYLLMIMGLLFVEGMRTVVQDGLDHRKTIVAGLAFAIGSGLQNQTMFADLLGAAWGTLLGNGMTVGVLAAILLTSFVELTSPRRRRLEAELDISALPKIDAFLRELVSRLGWNDTSTARLRSAGEETLLTLLRQDDDDAAATETHLIVVARPAGSMIELDFIGVSERENIEDRLAYLSDQPEIPDEREISFRLLRHYASSVRHQKYHGIDIVTVQVEGAR